MANGEKVIIGLSGGVDSAVAAYVLKEAGYLVTGVFMKNWDEKDENGVCSAAKDLEDVISVCSTLDIPYYTVNFEQEYYDRVFSYFLEEYKRGRTPNPDVACNSEIKFSAFLDYALKLGAQKIATGHYVKTIEDDDGVWLKKGEDKGKDQSYFLCMLNQEQIKNAIFPVGGMQKSEVRQIAEKLNLSVAKKKDSTGICFIGERKMKEFLKTYIPANPGIIMTPEGKEVAKHEGLMYYTLGQRRGLGIGGAGNGERWFVVGKDLKNNILYVTQGEGSELYSKALKASNMNFITKKVPNGTYYAKFRYRQSDQKVYVEFDSDKALVSFEQKQRAITPGQYVVLYDGDICLGGGIIDEVIF